MLDFIKNPKVYQPIIIVVVAILVYKIISSIVKYGITKDSSNSYEAKKRKTIATVITNIIKYIILTIAVIGILQVYGVNTTSIIASLGVASAVIGLAFQDALKDVIGGITIIMENYYIVGDYITYNNFTGKVISIGLKSTKIQNVNNEILVIANRNVTEVINLSQAKNSVLISIPVAYEESIDNVEKAIDNVIKELQNNSIIIPSSIKYLGVNELASSSVNYLLILTAEHDMQWQAKRDALKVIKSVFDKEKIKIPYNQIEVHNG